MGITGYNYTEIQALDTEISATAQQAGSKIIEILQDNIVTPMSQAWFAPEGIDYFNEFAKIVSDCGPNITSAFDSYRKFVQDLGTNWAGNTGGTMPILQSVQAVELSLDVSCMKEKDESGNIGIDEAMATAIADNLDNVEAQIKTELQSLANDLSVSSSFLGHDQAAKIEELFTAVSGSIYQIFKFLAGDGENNLKNQIIQIAKKYGDIAENVANSATNAINETTTE